MRIIQTITVPQESVNDEYLTVVGMPFSNGDFVKKGDTVIEFETSKALLSVEAECDGNIYYYCSIEEEVTINKIVVEIKDRIDNEIIPLNIDISQIKPQQKNVLAAGTIDNINGKLFAVTNPNTNIPKFDTVFSKAALQILAEKNIDKKEFVNFDFVSKGDVLIYLNPASKIEGEVSKAQNKNNNHLNNPLVLPDNITIERLSVSKRREIAYLSSVQTASLVSTLNIDIDTSNIFYSINGKLKYFKDSLLPIIIYEAALLLKKYDKLNAFYIDDSIVKYNYVNIGIAIDIDDGLKVININNTNEKSISKIEDELMDLSNKYLDKKLESKDLTDITFTITDLSSFGISSFIPLINKSNSAILAISKIDKVTGVSILGLSFDHRVSEGRYASQFLLELKGRIESYSFMKKKADMLNDIVCYKCFKEITEDLNEVGFIKVINNKREDKFICDSCLLKF